MTADITALLASAERGDRAAADAVFSALYDELHRMARRELANRGGGVTLSATTLLHDAYLEHLAAARAPRSPIAIASWAMPRA